MTDILGMSESELDSLIGRVCEVSMLPGLLLVSDWKIHNMGVTITVFDPFTGEYSRHDSRAVQVRYDIPHVWDF